MSVAHIERLPEELLIHILTYLDTPPPSERKLRQEPSLRLTVSDEHAFKDVSCVSKRWRRLVLPLLFKHTRLRLDETPRTDWAQCSACTEGALQWRLQHREVLPIPGAIDQYHLDMLEDVVTLITGPNSSDHASPPLSGLSGDPIVDNFLTWSSRFYHSLRDFLDFLQERDLTSKVQSLVVMSEQMLPEKLARFPHLAAVDKDWRYKAAAALWQHLFSVVDLERVVILAAPVDLACLTNCAIDTFGDWAFGDMDYHILDLRVDRKGPRSPAMELQYSSLQYMPHRYPGLAGSSILNLRQWSHIGINEGAFLKAYGTYEYFERGPPSLIYSIKDSLSPRPIFSPHARISDVPLASLRSLTYTGIFPFANHLDFRELLPQLEELDMQLAPEPASNILNERDRVGKAELQDCWSELISIYQGLAILLATFRISERNVPRLKKFVCRDSKIIALQEELDEVFIPLCLPVWVQREPGLFTRQAMSAEGHASVDMIW
ncbi:hypothetical protein LTR36_010359 [Oleoguttula mirabilis]|uniref:F-box domain-containing protein n=1 Tax=Oleoguttula mirabilis TaxID=1507867 RepID=A0AAV9J4D7_9PEZI|nr:hypothetical protein LTR36_010359 [Oleoguttula mirabilis]